MAWKEINVVDQRKSFIQEFLSGNFKISELCRIYEISRPTAYLWIERYITNNDDSLEDRSSKPNYQPHETPDEIVDQILFTKHKWMSWGPKKIKAYLCNNTTYNIPSVTTVGNILKKHGLVKNRKIRSRIPERTQPLAHAKGINDVWSADFKGKFFIKDGVKCEPFTLTDNDSRFLLKCVSLDYNDTDHVWAILDLAFREYGLPLYLRTDNGPPFASTGIGRFTTLSIKLIKAGVIPDYIDPGKPEQNGRHERMHGTLKNEAVFPDLTLEEQKMQLDRFQMYYNFERPHEGINHKTPGSVYRCSNRVWSGRLSPPEYDDNCTKLKVKKTGQVRFKGKDVFVGRALTSEYIGIKEKENGFEVFYGPISIGKLNENGDLMFVRRPGRKRNTKFKSDFY